MEEEFDKWNGLKKKIAIEIDKPNKFPKEGEVWGCNLGKNIGFEQNGMGNNFFRPVLIIKRFNNHMFWCVPLSTKQKHLDFYFNFLDPHKNKVSAILGQIRLLSLKRLHRDMYQLDKNILKAIKIKIRSLI